MVTTGKNRDDAGKAIRNISEETFSSAKFTERNTGGYGNFKTKLISFADAIQLVMVLPGKIAKETRAQFADIIRRYMGGDASMHEEIEANANSTSPIAQMARASLQAQAAQPVDEQSLRLKRRREELEIQALGMQNIKQFREEMDWLDPNWARDTRIKLQLQDVLKDIVLGKPSAAQGEPSPNNLISISEVVQKMGHDKLARNRSDLTKIGKRVAEAYRKKYNQPPPKCSRFIDGAVREINGYTQRDWDLIAGEIQDYIDEGFE